jgi:peptidoglycan/LPS O-acetylase OafA/YrhL
LSHGRLPARLKRIDSALGDLTYPLYLNHYAVSVAALTLFASAKPSFTLFALTLVASVAFSYGAMLLTEPLTKGIRDRIRGRRL